MANINVRELSPIHQGKELTIRGEFSSIVLNPSGHLDLRILAGGGQINFTVDPVAARNLGIEVNDTPTVSEE